MKLIRDFIAAIKWAKDFHSKELPNIILFGGALPEKLTKEDGYYSIIFKKNGDSIEKFQLYNVKLTKKQIKDSLN